MAEDEDIKQRQYIFCRLPGRGPDAAIVVPAAQPTLRRGRDNAPATAWEERDERGRYLLCQWTKQDDRCITPLLRHVFCRVFLGTCLKILRAKPVGIEVGKCGCLRR